MISPFPTIFKRCVLWTSKSRLVFEKSITLFNELQISLRVQLESICRQNINENQDMNFACHWVENIVGK